MSSFRLFGLSVITMRVARRRWGMVKGHPWWRLSQMRGLREGRKEEQGSALVKQREDMSVDLELASVEGKTKRLEKHRLSLAMQLYSIRAILEGR